MRGEGEAPPFVIGHHGPAPVPAVQAPPPVDGLVPDVYLEVELVVDELHRDVIGLLARMHVISPGAAVCVARPLYQISAWEYFTMTVRPAESGRVGTSATSRRVFSPSS